MKAFFSKQAQGYTLIELLVIIVVVAIVLGALLGIFTASVGRSADPMLRMQAIAIAQAYLEEALLKAYQDPDQPETGCEEGASPANRANYDDVRDYGCVIAEAPVDYLGNSLTELDDYIVDVTVTPDTLGAGAQQANTQRVDVTVTHATQPLTITLTGHRAQY
ncbi:MAG TPA: prepilin-type N-terminal cleavage/methylation domain-containing protein [Gammaproteobacteria bacterium]|jgi:MSHA pilin protein MshD